MLQLHTNVTLELPSPVDAGEPIAVDATERVRGALWHTAIATCAIVESYATAPRRARRHGAPSPDKPIRQAIHTALSLFDHVVDSWLCIIDGEPDAEQLIAARDGLQLAATALSAIIVADYDAAGSAMSKIRLPRLADALAFAHDDDDEGDA